MLGAVAQDTVFRGSRGVSGRDLRDGLRIRERQGRGEGSEEATNRGRDICRREETGEKEGRRLSPRDPCLPSPYLGTARETNPTHLQGNIELPHVFCVFTQGPTRESSVPLPISGHITVSLLCLPPTLPPPVKCP